jgi:serine/threonine protein kinase
LPNTYLWTYVQVYQGTLSTGQRIAIKRAQKDSMQGGNEFKTEIELLSRVHHKNLVTLEGFCFEQAEQMLVYEYIPNGTVMDSLSGTFMQFFTLSSQFKFWQRLKLTSQNLLAYHIEFFSLIAFTVIHPSGTS